jgi:hypothetical protein
MVDDPIRLPLEQSAAWVDVHRLVLYQGSVSFLGILPGSMEKEASGNRFPNFGEVLPSCDNIQFISAEKPANMLAHGRYQHTRSKLYVKYDRFNGQQGIDGEGKLSEQRHE